MKFFAVLLLLLPFLCSAEELKVNYLARSFIINYSLKKIEFKSKDSDLSMIKKNCSEQIFKNFLDRLRDLGREEETSLAKENVTYTWKKKTYKASLDSGLGLFLVYLPDEMRRMKIEEKIRCSN